MQLKRYINSFPRSQRMAVRQHLADQVGVGTACIGHWLAGIRQIPAERAVQLEQATDGAITRYELRPDLFPTVQARLIPGQGTTRSLAYEAA